MVLTYLVVGEEAKRGVRALKDQSELFSHRCATLADEKGPEGRCNLCQMEIWCWLLIEILAR